MPVWQLSRGLSKNQFLFLVHKHKFVRVAIPVKATLCHIQFLWGGRLNILDLALIVQWREDRPVSFDATKTKIATFRHHRADLKFVPVLICGYKLKGSPCLERLLGLNLKCNSYVRTISKVSGRMVRFLLSFQKISISFCNALSIWESNQSKNRAFLPHLCCSCTVLTAHPW